MNKLSIFLKMIKVVKNWQIIILVYFGIYNKEFYILNLRNELKIKLRTKSTDLQAFTNVWILKEYEVDGFTISDSDVIIDIGGHIGLFALFVASKSKKVKIISIEPYPENFNLLEQNIKNNNLQNSILINKAVSNTNDDLKLFVNSFDDAAHSIHEIGDKVIQIKGITLNQIMLENKIEKCNILKMDCEGAEFEIINSLSDNELTKIEKICLEYHIKQNDATLLNDLKNRLVKMNYNINIEPTNNFLGMLYARNKVLAKN